MPAFGGALSDDEIKQILGYIRGMCTDAAWPRGELNLPRPLRHGEGLPGERNGRDRGDRRHAAAAP